MLSMGTQLHGEKRRARPSLGDVSSGHLTAFFGKKQDLEIWACTGLIKFCVPCKSRRHKVLLQGFYGFCQRRGRKPEKKPAHPTDRRPSKQQDNQKEREQERARQLTSPAALSPLNFAILLKRYSLPRQPSRLLPSNQRRPVLFFACS